jgi:hypothetical protein
MSEPRYPTRVGDPDETARIPKDALDALRDADQANDAKASGPSGGSQPVSPSRPGDGARPTDNRSGDGARPSDNRSGDGARPTDNRSGVRPTDGRPPNGSGPGQRTSGPNSGATPAVGPDNRQSGFRPASGTNGTGVPAAGMPPGGSPSGGSPSGLGGGHGHGPGPNGAQGSITGYRRSDYAPPPAYSGYGGYSPVGDAPTTVAGPGGATTAAAARTALGAATRPGTRPSPTSAGRPARRARLLVRHIDPWSTLKFSFVLAVAMFFVWLVAIGVLYGVLDGMGVFEQINGLYDEVSGNGGDSLFSPGLVLGTAALVGVVNIVLFTALATIGSFVYNICSDLVGGIEITLAEKD